MKKLYWIAFILICCFGSCKKETASKTNQNLIAGKLKFLEGQVPGTGTPIDTMYFIYDSTSGKLKEVREFSGDIIGGRTVITMPDQNTIHCEYFVTYKKFVTTIHLDVNKRIISINDVDTLTGEESMSYSFISKNNKIDTVYRANVGYINVSYSDIKNYDFIFNAGNCIRATRSYTQFLFSPPLTYDTCIANFTFTNLYNDNQLPIQNVFDQRDCIVPFYPNLSYLYFAGLLGYFAFEPNKNLIASCNGRSFIYTQNSINEVIKMEIDSFITYKMTYY